MATLPPTLPTPLLPILPRTPLPTPRPTQLPTLPRIPATQWVPHRATLQQAQISTLKNDIQLLNVATFLVILFNIVTKFNRSDLRVFVQDNWQYLSQYPALYIPQIHKALLIFMFRYTGVHVCLLKQSGFPFVSIQVYVHVIPPTKSFYSDCVLPRISDIFCSIQLNAAMFYQYFF